ncbi:MAG: stage III sporulation protein AD [Firmicutes bacterium]|jgi:stage III sporulation protein AD|nr:stage III sporulation protein AD [Bacillota bacterium]
MEIVRVLGIALISALLIVLLRQEHEELALLLGLLVAALIFLFAVTRLESIVVILQSLAQHTGVSPQYLTLILKIIAIAYIAEFGSQICRDADLEALAGTVELAGRVIILLLSAPIIVTIFNLVLKLLP